MSPPEEGMCRIDSNRLRLWKALCQEPHSMPATGASIQKSDGLKTHVIEALCHAPLDFPGNYASALTGRRTAIKKTPCSQAINGVARITLLPGRAHFGCSFREFTAVF